MYFNFPCRKFPSTQGTKNSTGSGTVSSDLFGQPSAAESVKDMATCANIATCDGKDGWV